MKISKFIKRMLMGLSFLTIINTNLYSQLKIKDVQIVSKTNHRLVADHRAKNVTLDDKVTIYAVVKAEDGNKLVYFTAADSINLEGKILGKKEIRRWDNKYGDVAIRWYKLEPSSYSYSNLNVSGFMWDKIDYKETLMNNNSTWSIDADAHPTDSLKDVNNGLGTMRFKVEILYNNKKVASPGKESRNSQGIKDNVARVSFRKDDSYLGWLTSFFNLPYIYGSAGKNDEDHQTERYIGMDCADLVVGAYRMLGKKIPYTYSGGLMKYANTIFKQQDLTLNGDNFYHKGKVVRYGRDVKNGDIILFGKWHVGVLVGDKSDSESFYKGDADGVFNKYDLIIHTLFDSPKKENIQNILSGFSVLRWK